MLHPIHIPDYYIYDIYYKSVKHCYLGHDNMVKASAI